MRSPLRRLGARVATFVAGFTRAFALPGCFRLTAIGLGLLVARTFTTPASRWAAIPVVVETSGGPEEVDADRTEVEALLGPDWGGDATLRDRVARAVVEESRAAGFDPLLVMAVIRVESDDDADAVSARGARGLMQLRTPTLRFMAAHEGLGVIADGTAIEDPAVTVRLGVRYLHRLDHAFGDLGLALVAYNAGPHRVSEILRAGEPLPESLRAYPRQVRRTYLKLLAQVGADPAAADVQFPLSPRLARR